MPGRFRDPVQAPGRDAALQRRVLSISVSYLSSFPGHWRHRGGLEIAGLLRSRQGGLHSRRLNVCSVPRPMRNAAAFTRYARGHHV